LLLRLISNTANIFAYTGESRYLEVHGIIATFRVIRNTT